MESVARKPIKARGARFEAAAEVFWREADAMHTLLAKRADELIGCLEDSPEEEELRTITDVIETYEAKRWPSGKVAGGKGSC